MTNLRITLLAAVLLTGASASAAAQALSPLPPPEAPTRLLTLQDCVGLAAQKNPVLVSADYAAQAGRAVYDGSYNGVMPALNLTNSATEGNPSMGSKPAYTAQASAAMNLFNMAQVASIRSAAASYSQAEASLRVASANVRFNLISAFASAHFAEKSVEMAQRIVDIQQRNADEVTLRYESGNEYKGNMMNAKAQLLQAQAALTQAIRSERTTRRALDQQIGIDEFEDVAVTGTLVAQTPPNFPAQMSAFLEQRPDIAVQEAAVRSAAAALASSESTLYPTLTANYSRSRFGPAEFPSASYAWSAGAVLSYPIFGAGPTATYFNVKAGKDGLAKSQQDLRSVRDAAVVDLENSWANYATSVDQAIAQDALLQSLRQRNDEGAVRYASGLLTFDNWQVIVTSWVSAEQQNIQAEQSAVIAQAQWEKSLGKALGE